jgi:release factor glutamine methyltransferase
MSARTLVDRGAERLAGAGVETPRLDAELLLAAAVGASRSEIVAGLADPAGAEPVYEQWIARRERREPLAYITGSQGFRGIDLAVDRRVLIPRPETELLVELVIAHRPRTILDVATGSGAVALALADELPDAAVTASDVSEEALELAAENARALGLGRVEFVHSDLLGHVAGRFDAICANLPYVTRGDLATLQPEVARYEPRLALDGGDDGLDLVRRFVRTSPTRLELGGLIALEIGLGQATKTAELLAAAGFVAIECHEDLCGIERVVTAEAPR